MFLKKELVLFLLSVLIFNIKASEVSKITPLKAPDEQTRIKSLVSDFFKEQQWKKLKKLTTAIGAVKGKYKDKSSSTHMKGNNNSHYLSLSYQFLPDFSFGITPVRSFSKAKNETMDLKIKSSDKLLATNFDYKIMQWLTINLSFAQKWGKNTTSSVNATNPESNSKNTCNTPGIIFKFSLPVTNYFFILPDAGFSRTNINNKAFVDNNNNSQKKQILIMDQLSINSKACFLINDIFIPYIGIGYTKVTKYKLHLKSKNSFKFNTGILLFGGIANIDCTISKTNNSVTSSNYSANLSTKF